MVKGRYEKLDAISKMWDEQKEKSKVQKEAKIQMRILWMWLYWRKKWLPRRYKIKSNKILPRR